MNNNIDIQLRWFIDLLNAMKIHYWLDSGSLLGMIRDGALIKDDNDLDISIWADQTEKIEG